MTHYLDELAFEFEKHMVNPEDVEDSEFPEIIAEYISLYNKAKADGNWMDSDYIRHYGGPTGIAKHPEHGWALIGAGQGPFIMWSEMEDSEK